MIRRHPDVGLGAGTIARGTAAVGLGALLTPLASILAFIEPGLDQNIDCSELIQETKERTAQQPPGSAAIPEKRTHNGRDRSIR